MSESDEKEELLKAIHCLKQLVGDQSEQIATLKAQIRTSKPFTLEKKVKWDEIGKRLP